MNRSAATNPQHPAGTAAFSGRIWSIRYLGINN
jgi:hypothetical protein